MHDIKWIRENREAFEAQLKKRGASEEEAAQQTQELIDLDQAKRALTTRVQEAQAKKNQLSKEAGQAKAKGQDAAPLFEEARRLGEELSGLEAQAAGEDALTAKLERIPNMLADDVPQGADQSGNVQVKLEGAKPEFSFPAKDHVDLGEALGLMDFEAAAKMSGARFVVLKGALAKLERALAQFMLDSHTAGFGYEEVSPPYLVKDQALYGTGQLPKFSEDLFSVGPEAIVSKIDEVILSTPSVVKQLEADKPKLLSYKDAFKSEEWRRLPSETLLEIVEEISRTLSDEKAKHKHWLIPTAEVSITNIVANQIIDTAHLPVRMTAHTPCFRSEAGSAGRDTRGMIRQHQFSKVEMVSITTPEQSQAEHERMLSAAETILQKLGLHYRVMLLCAGDTGFSAQKTYDLEVWLPGQGAYREISSVSNCGAFQARRMKTRYRAAGEKQTQFVHTLNGSGLAVGRTMVAILENYQEENGTIRVPEALVPYMGGMTTIGKRT